MLDFSQGHTRPRKKKGGISVKKTIIKTIAQIMTGITTGMLVSAYYKGNMIAVVLGGLNIIQLILWLLVYQDDVST